MARKKIPEETIKLINPQINYIRRKFNPKQIILFGSRARGDNLKTSDVDLIVISEKFKNINFHDRMVQAYGLWNKPIDLEVFCYTPEEFERKKKQIGIIREAVKEGIVIT